MTDFILDAIARAGYLGIFLLMILENVFPPIPSEVIMGLAGMAVARGDLLLVPLILIATVGTTVGNYFWYWIGRHIGYARFKPIIDRYGRWLTLDWHEVERIHQYFVDRGGWVIFVFRFMPVFRTIISLPAGAVRMPLPRFLTWTFAGSAIWNTMLALGGVLLGSRFHELDRFIGPLAIASIVGVVLLYLYRVMTWKPHVD